MIMSRSASVLTKIGVFYDGGYFQAVSDFYKYAHLRQSRLDIQGFPSFIENQVAQIEGTDVRGCHVVDAHYFRGRFCTDDVIESGHLEDERRWDDLLMRSGVVAHHLARDSRGKEKGIDVWLALEAFEQAIHKRFDVLVLVACDGDYAPLIKKLHSLGTRVMLLAWDVSWTDNKHALRTTRTAQVLLDEVMYPISMHTLIDDRAKRDDPFINGLFLQEKKSNGINSSIRLEHGGSTKDAGGPTSKLEPPRLSDKIATTVQADEQRFERVIRIIELQSRTRGEIVLMSYLGKTAIPESMGFSQQEAHLLLEQMVSAGLISTSKRPNPKNREYPTTCASLNREHPIVKRVLENGQSNPHVTSNGDKLSGFRPIKIEGSPLSEEIIRDRR